MSRRPTVLACLVTALLLVPATPALAAADDIDYIALGDSYSSGVGAPGQAGLCLRSSRSYTTLWAERNDPASYKTVACGGAKTGDVRSWQVLRCWVSEFIAVPELDANANAIAFETIVLQNEGFVRDLAVVETAEI